MSFSYLVCGQKESNGGGGYGVGGQQPHIPPSMWSGFCSGFLADNQVIFLLPLFWSSYLVFVFVFTNIPF